MAAATDPGPVKPSTAVTALQVYQVGPPPIVSASYQDVGSFTPADDSVSGLDA